MSLARRALALAAMTLALLATTAKIAAAHPHSKQAQTFATLPFFNQISVVEDVGCEPLRQLLERGYSGLPGIAGQFANIAGMRVEVDPTQPAQVISAAPAPVAIVTPGACAISGSITARRRTRRTTRS